MPAKRRCTCAVRRSFWHLRARGAAGAQQMQASPLVTPFSSAKPGRATCRAAGSRSRSARSRRRPSTSSSRTTASVVLHAKADAAASGPHPPGQVRHQGRADHPVPLEDRQADRGRRQQRRVEGGLAGAHRAGLRRRQVEAHAQRKDRVAARQDARPAASCRMRSWSTCGRTRRRSARSSRIRTPSACEMVVAASGRGAKSASG